LTFGEFLVLLAKGDKVREPFSKLSKTRKPWILRVGYDIRLCGSKFRPVTHCDHPDHTHRYCSDILLALLQGFCARVLPHDVMTTTSNRSMLPCRTIVNRKILFKTTRRCVVAIDRRSAVRGSTLAFCSFRFVAPSLFVVCTSGILHCTAHAIEQLFATRRAAAHSSRNASLQARILHGKGRKGKRRPWRRKKKRKSASCIK
jgi:hypothetical protein